jgi:ATP-dependent RNA helicase CshB
MVKKNKKTVKPGYKRRIKNNIARDEKYKKRVAERESLRATKKAKKKSHKK